MKRKKTAAPEAEEIALGSVLNATTQAEAAALVRQLRPEAFRDVIRGRIASAMLALVAESHAVDGPTLALWLKEKHGFDFSVASTAVSRLAGCAATAFDFSGAWSHVLSAHRRHQVKEWATRAAQIADDPSVEPESLHREFVELGEQLTKSKSEKVWFAARDLHEWRDVKLPDNISLIGTNHVNRGNVIVLGGHQGVGKSRMLSSLGLAGALGAGSHWMGLPVHRAFRTLIIQAENGAFRLQAESADILQNREWAKAVKGKVKVSDCPPGGLPFHRPEFRGELRRFYEQFPAEVVAIDPWNRCVSEESQKDYMEAFASILSCFPSGDDAPAVVITAHLRKPRMESMRRGRGLMSEVSGSLALTSVARCVFVALPGSDEESDDRVVWCNAKNNDGPLVEASAWHRRNGLFEPCNDFDFEAFWNPGTEKPRQIELEHLESLFQSGKRTLTRANAVRELRETYGFGRSAAYAAFTRFADYLKDDGGLLSWKKGNR